VTLMRRNRIATLLLAGLTTLGSGCYYGHLAVGQVRVLLARESIDEVLEDPTTPDDLRHRLALVEEVRRFARDLGLEVGNQYTSYVAWPGDRIVTTVVATRPGEIEPAGFRFPVVGRLPYKGFFDPAAAASEADALRARGLDVCLVPVTAYSTLGWLDDPLTAPMLRASDGELAETLIHELVHATVFVDGQPAFNEGVARFVGEEGAIRFFAERAARSPDLHERERTRVSDRRRLDAALAELRVRVGELYAGPLAGDARARERAALGESTRRRVAELPLATQEPGRLAERLALNDACLALRGTYADDLPRHEALFAELGADLARFVDRLREAANRPDPRSAFFEGMASPSAALP
jgi:predicted aminopeptidase